MHMQSFDAFRRSEQPVSRAIHGIDVLRAQRAHRTDSAYVRLGDIIDRGLGHRQRITF